MSIQNWTELKIEIADSQQESACICFPKKFSFLWISVKKEPTRYFNLIFHCATSG